MCFWLLILCIFLNLCLASVCLYLCLACKSRASPLYLRLASSSNPNLVVLPSCPPFVLVLEHCFASAAHSTFKTLRRKNTANQAKAAWFDSACADCPGFQVPGAAGAPAPSCIQEPRMPPSPPNWHLLHDLFEQILESAAPTSPTTRARTRRTAHVFPTQGGTHREKADQSCTRSDAALSPRTCTKALCS